MGSSSQFDIVARLQLRADQFSSETGARFAEMSTRAKAAANNVRSSFGQSFAEVQKLAEQSLKLPRTASGSLDLSGEIASLRQSAAAADQKAAVARESNAAMLAASSSSRTVTEAMRLEADAAMVAARAEEADANAIRQRILALEAVQVELNKTAGATTLHTRAANDNVVSAEQQRQAMMMAGQQAQDFAVQVANGGSVATAFSQQIGQLAFAAQNMGGKLAGVATFLMSGWGIAATIGAVVLTPLIAKVLEQNNALDDAVDKLKKQAAEAETSARAQDTFARSAEGVGQAIRDQTKALDEGDKALRSRAEQANIDAKIELQREIGIRRSTLAMIEQAKVLAEIAKGNIASGGPGGAQSLVAAQYAAEVERLETLAKAQQGKITEAEQSVQRTRIDLAAEAAKRAVDPMARIKKLYDDQAAAAQAAATAEAKRGKAVDATLTRELAAIEAKRQAAIKTEQARQAAANKKPPSLGSQITTEQGGRILSSAQTYLGARENTAGGKATLRELFSGAGIAPLDPEKTAWCAAFVNAVLAGQGIKGNGSLAARSFLNYGTAIQKPQQGDIVVLRTGKTQEHVGFYAGEGAGGRVLVTGGNQGGGKEVTTSSFARSQVEAFRRAPTASASYVAELKATATAAREAEQEQKRLDQSLEQILGKFDPASDAARKYREELEAIDKLAVAGKITPEQQFDYTRSARKNFDAAQTAASGKLLRDTFGDAEIDAALATFDAGVQSAVDSLEEGVRDAGASFGDGLREAVGSAMDLLGVRVNGPMRSLLQPGGIEGQAKDAATALTDGLKNSNLNISPASIEKLTDRLGSVLANASYGQIGGSVFASITGGKNNALASSLGGVLGGEAGKAIGSTIATTVGGTLGKTLGSAAGPLGAIAGGILGNVIGGLFKKTVKGSAGISTDASGTLVAGSASGTSSTVKAQASTLAGSVASGLQSIAEQLGAQITGTSNVQIGLYKDKLRVSTNGTPIGGKGSSGAITFTDETAAIKYAIQDALQDGVLSGISAASLAILQSGQDLERALTKALLIESVPKDLKAMLDPVGAAIDDLNTKFQKTVDALKEGGASAEQMAQAQQLYDLQLEQVKSSTASASQSLKDFLSDLQIGSGSAYSLRDQEAAAKDALQPYLASIAAGQSVDQAKYQAAASAFLDIERELYGSTQAYFDALDGVQAATNRAISTIDNAVPIGGSVDSPFVKATADSTAASAEALKTANQMAEDTNALLARLVAAAEAGGSGEDASGFIGEQRMFA